MIFQVAFKLIHPQARVPMKAFNSAGWDIYGVPDPVEGMIIINPQCLVKFKTGLTTEFPPSLVARILNKSGPGLRGLQVLAGVIDSDYRGEWIIGIVNSTANPIPVNLNKSIAQVCFYELPQIEWVSTQLLSQTQRGEGNQGSSGQ